MKNKQSATDQNYKIGGLSVFPQAKDSKLTLHEARNNVENFLQQTLSINAKFIVLNDASKFPDSGIIKIVPKNAKNLLDASEVVLYKKKIGNQLHFLQRGYSGSHANTWPAGSKVCCPLMAEHHNAIRDAIVKIEQKIGLKENPSSDSIFGLLNYLEGKWLQPRPSFRAWPRSGKPGLQVTFHNFSSGISNRFLWDFGDGSTTNEKNPIHTYYNEGTYTVSLTMISENGSQALSNKQNYITVSKNISENFFHVIPGNGTLDTTFEFIDQSEGDIIERHWYFGDGEDQSVFDASEHTIYHQYSKPGTYNPSLTIRMKDNTIKRMISQEELTVI